MPYAKNEELPDGVKVLPTAGQTMWRKVFNASHGKYGEEKAFAIAWGAVKRAFKKSGDKWLARGEAAKTVADEVFGALRKMIER